MDTHVNYSGLSLEHELSIDQLYSVHYFEYTSDYVFAGEAHDFWEFLYVDRGAVIVTADQREHRLIKGELIFHRPGEFHSVRADGRIAPNLIVISFSTRSPAMQWFTGKRLRSDDHSTACLTQIIDQSQLSFSSPLGQPNLRSLTVREDRPFASLQLIQLHLELFLISLLKRSLALTAGSSDQLSTPLSRQVHSSAYSIALSFLESHLHDQPCLDQVCSHAGYSAAYLGRVFREKTGHSVMEHYRYMKIEETKQLIREGRHSLAQIAHIMGFSSSQHFSKSFRRCMGMTPSEYASSVKLNIS
ncbi:MAG: AraC family transcriptional regulator [Spirochaetia bacterium]|nr:AraC family transcriptional regulator [Spirochaetia bacterium]